METILSANSLVQRGYVSLADVNFPTNKYRISSSYALALKQIALLMKKNNKATLLIAGHTDNVGDNAVNDALSKKRERVLKKYLISLELIPLEFLLNLMGKECQSS